MTEFIWPIRVYYEDTDSGGVVYYANYLKFMERARTEWLRTLGVEQDHLVAQRGVIFAVRRAAVDYHKPARFNDALHVTSRIAAMGKTNITFTQRVIHAGPDRGGELLCTGEVQVVCLKADTFRPCELPAEVKAEIKRER